MIETVDLSKKYGDKLALCPTTVSFEKGKTTALIGPSGCGKSTFLRLITGLIPPTTGSLRIDGNDVVDWMAARRKIGYVVQDGGLFPHLTAGQNVTLMSRYLHHERAKIESRLADLSRLTRFPTDGLSRYPAELSGGQKQRVSLMRALALEPDILLLDEPLGALDPMVRADLQTDLKEIFQRLRQTVVFVTHDMAEAAFLGDEIILLSEGKVVQRGTVADLRERPATEFVSAFITAQRSLVAL